MARVFTIDSEVVKVSPGWSISDKINARTTASFTVVSLNNLAEINIGDEVIIQDGLNKLFGGTIENIEVYEDSPNYIEYNVTAVDFSALADKRLIADSVSNELAGDIITNTILPILAEEGVTTGNIENGPLISKAVFDYKKGSTALDYIKDVSGLNWEIDFDKQLNFYKRDTNLAPFILSNSVQHSSFVLNKTRDQYRNVQLVRGGQGKTIPQVLRNPTPKPDGVSQNFVVNFPVAEKPRIFIDSVEVDSSYIGVNGLDTGKKWYFSYNSNVIAQDTAETPLSTEIIQITYVGLYPLLAQAQNTTQINERALKETGTSGKYESITEEKSIDEVDQAIEFTEGLLDKYGIIPSTVTFETEVAGLKAGQLLTIDKPQFGISDSFLIEEVNLYANGQQTAYSVKCLDGSSLGGWEEYFKDLLKGSKSFSIRENEVVTRILVFQEVITISENFTLDLDGDEVFEETVALTEDFETVVAAPETRVGFAIVGYSEVGEE